MSSTDKINWLLFFVPLGMVAGKLDWSPVTVFTLNFLAIIPLAAILSFATEAISEHVGGALGGLLNATLGNAVELIVRSPRNKYCPSRADASRPTCRSVLSRSRPARSRLCKVRSVPP